MNWITINNFSDIDQIKEDSKYNPQFIFKHSTRCSISKMVMNRFESTYNSSSISVYLLDLLKHRDLSNKISFDFLVKHESPQLLVIKDKMCSLHLSHTDINQFNILD
jgi:bacillithiol system protein YtxJ